MEAKNGSSRKGRWGLANKIEGKSAKLLTPTVLTLSTLHLYYGNHVNLICPEVKKSSYDDRHEQLLM
jgi:hypothetical protein